MLGNPTLKQGAVHIWQIDLSLQGNFNDHTELLSVDENERSDRFYFEKDRRRFIASRRALRVVLSKYLSIAPQDVAFFYATHGKPELTSGLSESGIRFNLSHSGELALIAVVQDLQVGVDIELINREVAFDKIASRFFPPEETCILRCLSPEKRARVFFSSWTRKEAYIKALGNGFSLLTDNSDAAWGRGISAALLRAECFADELSRWSVYDISPSDKYAAALVVEGKKHRLEQRSWVDIDPRNGTA
jgi:4'-phosphopantetheinyl transferase